MRFGIIEVGSTNTKAYIYDNSGLINLGSRYISFKNNYNISNELHESDISDLYLFINDIRKELESIYIFGTSIFRKEYFK